MLKECISMTGLDRSHTSRVCFVLAAHNILHYFTKYACEQLTGLICDILVFILWAFNYFFVLTLFLFSIPFLIDNCFTALKVLLETYFLLHIMCSGTFFTTTHANQFWVGSSKSVWVAETWARSFPDLLLLEDDPVKVELQSFIGIVDA